MKNFGFLALMLFIAACGKESSESPKPENPQFLELTNVNTAPELLQEASKAVVQIVTDDGSGGTGSFIAEDGLLMTNNHVLGRGRCPVSGCYFKIIWNFEAGKKYETQEVFGIPQVVAPDLDLAVLQLYKIKKGRQGSKLSSPDFLKFSDIDQKKLLNKKVFAIGHPNRGLKKWSIGTVIELQGNWFYSNQMTLPGSSGSPVVNENGEIVGIHHRGARGTENITINGIRHYSVGTTSEAIVAALEDDSSSNSLSLLTDISESTDKDTFLANPGMFLGAHQGMISLPVLNATENSDSESSDIHASQIIAEYIDKKLASDDITNADELNEFKVITSEAALWFECYQEFDEKAKTYKTCPSKTEKAEWVARGEKLFELSQKITGSTEYQWVSEFPYAFASDYNEANKAALDAVKSHAENEELNFNLALWISSFTRTSKKCEFNGTNVADYVLNYKEVENYKYSYPEILNSLAWLSYWGHISNDDATVRFKEIMNDPEVTLGERIRAEVLAYRWGAL